MLKISSSSELFSRLAPIFLVISLFIVYLFSLAPDLTWAHDGADGGDLISAAATGGVAHPSGYPTFLLLARLFQFLPLGTIAYRTNLMVAVFTALTALLIYDIVVASPHSPAKGNRLAGLIAGFAYGLSPLAWSQAVITEVYGVHIFFVALILWLLVGRFAYSSNKWWLDIAIGLSMGLAMGNHLTSTALLPVVLLVGILPTLVPAPEPETKKGSKKKKDVQPTQPSRPSISWASLDWLSLGRRLGAVLVGLLIYASILWRASTKAPINWGYANNLSNLWWLVSGGSYKGFAFSMPGDEVLLRLVSVAQLLFTQFWILGLLAGIYYLVANFSLSRMLLITAWLAVTNTIFSLGYSTNDSFYYLLPFFLVFAIWIGLGAGSITRRLPQQQTWLSLGLSAILLVSFWGSALIKYPLLDLSRDHRTQKFEKAVLDKLPSDAIVVAVGDRTLFSMWYFHFVLKERPDIAVLSRGSLQHAWYIDVLRDTYPTLNIPVKEVSVDPIARVTTIPVGEDLASAEANAQEEADAKVSNALARVNPTRPVCNVIVFNDLESGVEEMTILCYMPASQKPETVSFSITEPIDQ